MGRCCTFLSLSHRCQSCPGAWNCDVRVSYVLRRWRSLLRPSTWLSNGPLYNFQLWPQQSTRNARWEDCAGSRVAMGVLVTFHISRRRLDACHSLGLGDSVSTQRYIRHGYFFAKCELREFHNVMCTVGRPNTLVESRDH
jgi:hypothetical protein